MNATDPGRSRHRLAPYLDLIAAFVEHKIAPADFRLIYFDMYLSDASDWTEEEFNILETLSGDVELYVADPELRPHITGGIGEEELHVSAERALEQIRRLRSSES